MEGATKSGSFLDFYFLLDDRLRNTSPTTGAAVNAFGQPA